MYSPLSLSLYCLLVAHPLHSAPRQHHCVNRCCLSRVPQRLLQQRRRFIVVFSRLRLPSRAQSLSIVFLIVVARPLFACNLIINGILFDYLLPFKYFQLLLHNSKYFALFIFSFFSREVSVSFLRHPWLPSISLLGDLFGCFAFLSACV